MNHTMLHLAGVFLVAAVLHSSVATDVQKRQVGPFLVTRKLREHEKPQDLTKIPGVPGVDYPIYHSVPPTSFHCGNVPFAPGMYANVETGCQISNVNGPQIGLGARPPSRLAFYTGGDQDDKGRILEEMHLYLLGERETDRQTDRQTETIGFNKAYHVCHDGREGDQGASFLCSNGTLFNQYEFTCDWWYNVNCADATAYYNLNLDPLKNPYAPKPKPIETLPYAIANNKK
uniref:Chitin-binding type-2 domain-containing protein n=1 Tax=Timema shepardi TaxID=629360 RepID=A0A7R9B2W4_TIMSH|nr:unnamed protein product [Timema shepardi]